MEDRTDRTLADALGRSAETERGIRFIAGEREESFLAYHDLRERALELLGGLQAAGVVRGDEVVFQLDDHQPFLTLFWACLLGGIVPVPLAVGSQADHRLKLWNVWQVLRRPWLVADTAQLGKTLSFAAAERPALAADLGARGLGWEELERAGRRGEPAAIAAIAAADLAYVQFSSGSTGEPKGIELTHRNLLTNVGDLLRAQGVGPDDVLLSWMPLTHDMGLIGAHLTPLVATASHCLMPTRLFIRRPALWMQKASEQRASFLFTPNFGGHYFLSSFKPEMAAGWDLSRARICNGAEPISAEITRRLVATLAPWGLRDGSVFPSYGLAEACVCVTTTPAWEPLRTHLLARRSLEIGSRVAAADSASSAITLVDLGFPLGGCQVRICDGLDRALDEDVVGHVQIRGGNVTRGYYRNAEATRQAFAVDGWLRTGDLGFLRAGRLVVTGRAKEMVIAGGANHYLYDIERLAEEVEGLEPGRVAACGLPRPEGGGDELILFLYWKGTPAEFCPLADRVRDHLLQTLGLTVEQVVPVRRIPKTTSGKVQRYKLAESYANGELAAVLQALAEARKAFGDVASPAAAPPQIAGLAGAGERSLLPLVRAEAERILGAPIEADRPLAEQGFDSRKAVALAAGLSRLCGREMPVSLAFDHPSLRAIARFAAGEGAEGAAEGTPRAPGGETVRAQEPDEPIAIIGFGCRFPGGADGPEGLWRVLAAGIDAVREVPAERWDVERYFDPDPEAAGKMVTRHGAFLDGVDLFDNAFFAVSAPEAEALDPQQRLLLEVSWEALEHAGQDVDRLRGSRTGVFVGLCGSDYATRQLYSGDPGRIDAYSLTGNAFSTAAGRISYVHGFQGPNLALDTACSSSLVAVHLAAQSLRAGESEMALAGGVNLILAPAVHVGFSRLKAMAPDGRCKTFDQAADGYVRGEGCGIVVLKRLADARAAGDRVLALIRGSAINQDGASNGLTAPSGGAQRQVIALALERAATAPREVRYVEAHGTGTPLGDPLEVRALAAVYGADRRPEEPLLIGSVKTNVGHTEAAAGVAGLLKVVLALTHEEIPATLHCRQPSPHIPWTEIPVAVATAPAAWRRGERPRLAGVSSFGFSGTNAHAVIAEAPAAEPVHPGERRVHVLPLSARSPEALAALLASYRPLLADEGVDLYDLCFAAAVRRTHHPHRAALVGASRRELLERLALAEEGLPGRPAGGDSGAGAVFLFPGQGSQWPGMARGLLRAEPAFRESMAACEQAFAPHVEWRLLAALEGAGAAEFLSKIDRIQPALFAVQVSLAALWRSWGVHPEVVVGHSMGEVAAAHVAGILSLEDAARIICGRSRLLVRASGSGAMVAVELGLDEAQAALGGREGQISVAASNSPRSTILSGDPAAVDAVQAELEGRGVFCRRIKVDVASHCHLMDFLRHDLAELLAGIAPRPAQIPMLSTVTSRWVEGSELDAAYWVANLRQPVLLSAAVAELLGQEHRFFVELAPHPVLLPAVEQCIEHAGREGRAHAVASLWRERPEEAELLGNLALLYRLGYPVAWRSLYATPGRWVDLPRYPWQRRRFWIDEAPAGRGVGVTPGAHPLLGSRLEVADLRLQCWETELDLRRLPYLEDHRIEESVVFPAAGWLEMLAAASRELHGAPWDLAGVEIVSPLALAPGGPRRVQVRIEEGVPASFAIHSALAGASGEWQLHVRGGLRPPGPPVAIAGAAGERQPPTARGERRSGEEHYRQLDRNGLHYGRRFQGVQETWRGERSALARIAGDPAVAAAPGYELHPALLDACLQTFAAADGPLPGPYLPVAIRRLARWRGPSAELWAEATWRPSADGESLEGDLLVRDPHGEPILRAEGIRLARLADREEGAAASCLYQLAWHPAPAVSQPLPAPGPLAIVAGRGELSRQAAEHLAARADTPVRVIAPGDPRPLVGEEGPRETLLYLCALDQPDEPDPERITADLMDLVRLVQRLAGSELAAPPHLVLVTRGAVTMGAVGPGAEPVLPGQAVLWGLGKTLAEEHPELTCSRLDLAPAVEAAEIGPLVETAAGGWQGLGPETALREGTCLVPRLEPAVLADDPAPAARPARGRPFRAVLNRPGELDQLVLRAFAPRAPGPGEVEVRVAATGLNFINVMSALGTYPGAPGGFRSLGVECAGRVSRVGPDVTRFAVGDEVVGLADDCLASHALARADLLAAKPPGLTCEQAATLPVAFLTAAYALRTLAGLVAGEKVLIHAATGGVGLAAVQLARRAGAEVFATAGSEEKRALLRRMGIRHVMDSRSLDFAGEVLAATGGSGVDVVLNSLAGEGMRASLALLAPCGRFLEIGKRDLYGQGRLDLGLLRRGASYFAIDLDLLAAERPALLSRLLAELLAEIAAGALEPLPCEVVALPAMGEAFARMAGGRHVGKIVLVPPPAGGEELQLDERGGPAFSAAASYLITGGCGALGLTAAEWMLARGAGHVVLLGRRGPTPPAALRIAELERRARAAGGGVTVLAADVADEGSLALALREIAVSLPPLRGVVHAAGVLADGPLSRLDEESCRRVLAPKVQGAWNLHRLTAGAELDLFVLFSSAAGLFGSAGQASYGAANAFLDGLAHYRRRRGQPALAIDLGPVSDVGLAAGAEVDGRFAARGLGSFLAREVPALLAAALGLGLAQVGALRLAATPGDHPLLIGLAAGATAAEAGGSPGDSLRALLASAPPAERRQILGAHLVEQLARVLRCPVSAITVDTSFKALGLDSLLAIQLAKRLGASLATPLSVTGFWSYPTVEQYRDHLAAKLGLDAGPASAPREKEKEEEQKSDPALLAALESLSDEAAERLLEQRLLTTPAGSPW